MTTQDELEIGTIERTLHIDASPELVFEVITAPEHLQEWWPDEAVLEARPGFVGQFVFGERDDPGAHVPTITVVEVDPPRRFSFRWVETEGQPAVEGNSLLVTFELTPDGAGTQLRMTERGFRERGWEVAVLEEHFQGHTTGWDHYLPQLLAYADCLGAAR